MKLRGNRIMIALDPAAPRAEALLALKAFRGKAQLELIGVFIENSDLQRLATLPIAREVRLTGTQPDPFNAQSLREQFDACARAMEQILHEAQRSLEARIRFQVLRGNVLVELQRAAAEMDWLIIGRSLRSAGPRTWLGMTPERIASAVANGPAPVQLLFVHEPWATGRSVLLLDDGTQAGQRAHEHALMMATADQLPLKTAYLLPADLAADTEPAHKPVITSLQALRRECGSEDPRVIVIPDTPAVRDVIDFEQLLQDLPASVAITR